MKFGLFVSLLIIGIIACDQHSNYIPKQTERAFYYWKSTLRFTDFEKAAIDSLKASTLYVKFFDVDWNQQTGKPSPVAQINILDTSYLQTLSIVPVVFITNECILKLDSAQAIPLAENICRLVNQVAKNNKLKNITELQIDCDWSATTKEKYFSVLSKIKLLQQNWNLSATIRLHQVKFVSRSGVPPVDKGLLMCYNMGNLKDPASNNSIIETTELAKYIGNLAAYPLPLDVAFPLFEWKVLFRNNSYSGLIQNLPEKLLTGKYIQKNENRYQFLKDTILSGYTFRKNDVLRNEVSDYKTIMNCAELVNEKLNNTNPTVSLYHLDSITLSKYSIHEMEDIYNSIH